ncbi:hypothetical protein DWB85_19080 [Seongchinamella sediminis]|uniref:Anti-sigma factor n=1 Tax=Seongchinamella sediminis TaxID=2283635 RepID=A0A3L7DU95_9GAMM|nr:hypothetical protein [Seongchinamella sediminis]RLQ20170.1 hypothetical protein DWB85_19080 [Seongchinamella sediminis]
MNEQDFQLLSQYLDGELDAIAARQLEQRLAAEPQLQATLDDMSGVEGRIKRAFAGTDRAPEAIAAMLRPASNVVGFPSRKRRPAWQYAVAASLVAAVGALLAPQWQQNTPASPTLADLLESTPAMAEEWQTLADGSSARPVLSFQSIDGSWCREYLVNIAGEGQRGVACREAGQWTTRVVAAAELPGSASEFRPAGAGDADAVADFLAEHAAGIALGAADEQALIDSHWQ